MKSAYLFFTKSTSNESFIHISYSVPFYWICDFKIGVYCVWWWQQDNCVYSGHFWQLYTTWRRPATVSIQWWLKLNHYNYLHMVSAWIGEWWCVYDTFKSKIYTLICFHGHRQIHLVTRLHQYLPYLSHGKGRLNWYWALGQEAETITKMNEIKGKTSATNRIVNNVSLRNL